MIRLATVLLRGVVILLVGMLIAGSTLTLAATSSSSQRPTLVPATSAPQTLNVPQVTGQVYVFAKGTLQDGGFAWRVTGSVHGYAGNRVVGQDPAAGKVVLDTGAPTITLTLARAHGYAERGTPDDAAPYTGTAVRLTKSEPAAVAYHG